MLVGHAFVSYVREDSLQVDRMQRVLEPRGVRVWRDTADLWPGEDWRAKIRHAITDNALVFIACFSRNSILRQKSYQREELSLAIEQMRLRSPDEPWLIPVRFDDCEIPEYDIGGGRSLASIQRADLFGVRSDEAATRLATAVLRILSRQSGAGPMPEMSDTPQAVIEVRDPNAVELQGVTTSSGREAAEVDELRSNAIRTIAVPTRTSRSAGQASWDVAMAPTLSRAYEFVVNEPLDRRQVLSGLFQGRGEHLSYVLRTYGNRLPNCPVHFHGIRKVGKSSLLNRVVVDLLEMGRRVDLVSAQGLQPRHEILAATVAGLCRRIGASAAGLTLPTVPPQPENPVLFFEEYLDAYARLGASVTGAAPILVVDEFQCLNSRECAQLMDVIRGMAEARRCGFIFAGVEGPSGIPPETGLVVEPRRVDFLSAVDVKNLLSAILTDLPIVVPDDVADIIFDESAGHPNFLSAILRGSFQRANLSQRNVICANDVWDASQEIAVNQQHMFDISWFSPTMLNDRERALAVDLAHILARRRGWLRVADVLKQADGDVRSALRVLENSFVIEAQSDSGGEMHLRIRGGVLERYLRMLYGARLERSPDSSRKLVGLFIDLDNVADTAISPESLGDQLLAFAERFGAIVAPTAVATSYTLSVAGWDARAVEASFIACGIRFEMPPPSVAASENAADMTLQAIIMQSAEQYNLAEIIIVSADRYFLPTAEGLLQGVEGINQVVSGRRVHIIDSYASESKTGKTGAAWTALQDERITVCQKAGLDGPDLLIWDAGAVIKNPSHALPITAERFAVVG